MKNFSNEYLSFTVDPDEKYENFFLTDFVLSLDSTSHYSDI